MSSRENCFVICWDRVLLVFFRMKTLVPLLLLPLMFVHPAPCQVLGPDTTYLLPGVEIRELRNPGLEGACRGETIDSLLLMQSEFLQLSDMLESNTNLFLKNYGQGNMASISINGTSSSQSGIYWHGFNLNAPGTGMIDLSLVPMLHFSALRMAYGGASSPDASAAPGGSVYLQTTQLAFDGQQAEAGISLGSFGEFRQQYRLKFRREDWNGYAGFQHTRARNDFFYSYRGETLKREHAELGQSSFLLDLNKQGKRHSISAATWLQKTNREIPPSVTSANMNDRREDWSARTTLRWKMLHDRDVFTAGLAFFKDYLHYSQIPGDTLVIIDSRIRNNTLQGDLTAEKHLKCGIDLSGRFLTSLQSMNVNNFGGYRQQATFGLLLSLHKVFLNGNWLLALDFREQWIQGYKSQPSPSLGLKGKLLNDIDIRLQSSRVNRYPALNDRFWVPGGNEELEAENGWEAQVGIHWRIPVPGKLKPGLSLEAHYASIQDWISWVPSSEGFWQAENVHEVEIMGLTPEMSLLFQTGPLHVRTSLGLALLSARDKTESGPLDNLANKQLIYTPEAKLFGSFLIEYRTLATGYKHKYTSESYITRDNSMWIPGFGVADAFLRYSYQYNSLYSIDIQIDVENVWSQAYEIVQYYPMPGRAFRLSLLIHAEHITPKRINN